MPIGKDSITKRVAKQPTSQVAETVETKDNTAPELVGTVAAAPKKTTAKTSTTSSSGAKMTTSTKTASTAAKSTSSTKTSSAKKPATAKEAEAPAVNTSVMANVSPETVEKVTGHKENTGFEKVQVGETLPSYLL